MKVSLKNWLNVRLAARAGKQDQWQVDNDLVFSGDNLEPRVLLNAVAFDDIAVVQEDAAFDSNDGINPLTGNSDTSVRDNDEDIPFIGGTPEDTPVDAISSSVAGLRNELGFDAADANPLTFNGDGTFQFDGTGSDVIQSLSANEVAGFNFQYQYVGQTPDAADLGQGTVTLGVLGANDPFEVEFGGPDYTYVANGNAVEFTDPLVVISDVDANDSYVVELSVAPANPAHTGPLGTLFLESEGEFSGGYSLTLEGSLDEINALVEEVRYKPANVDGTETDPYRLKQHIDITVTEIAGGNVDPGNQIDPEATLETTSVEGIAVLNVAVDGAGGIIFNEAPVANDDNIVFNEDGLVDFRVGNLLDNDIDPDGDTLTVTDVSFGGVPATEGINTFGGVDFSFSSEGNFGTLFFNEDGSYYYAFNDDVDFLAFGEQIRDEFEYNIIDTAWNTNVEPGTLKVTINGVNDAPEFQAITADDQNVHVDAFLFSGQFIVGEGGDVIFQPLRQDINPAVVAAAVVLDEQATPAPIEVDLAAAFTDLDASDLHDVQVNGVFLDGEVPTDNFRGQFKTEGPFFSLLSLGEVDNTDPENRVLPIEFNVNASSLNYLDAGDELYLIYEISATDPKGETASAFVKVKINGTEDKPILWVEGEGAVAEGDRGDDPITTTGILGIDGVDESDRSTFLPNNDRYELVGTYGQLQIEVDANGLESWVYTLDNESDLVQMLNEGEVVQDSFSLFIFDNGEIQFKLDEFGDPILDEHGAPVPHLVDITIDVTGTDDEPVVTYEPAWVAEGDVGHPTFVEGFVTITDIDSNDNPTFATNPLQPGSGTGIGTYGEITSVVQVANPDYDPYDAYSPEFLEIYTYVPNQELIQFLAAGEELTDVVELTAYDYTLVDQYGNTIVRELATKSVDIVIKGTNDAPEVTSDEVDAWEDPDKDTVGATVTADGTLDVSDVDLSNEVTVAAGQDVVAVIEQDVDGDGTYEEVSFFRDIGAYDSINTDIDGVTDALLSYLTLPEGAVVAAGDDTGVIEWSFDSGEQGFDFLGRDERLAITYVVTVTDSDGAAADATIVVNVLGKNDRPDIFVGIHDIDTFVFKEASSASDSGSQDADGYSVTGTLSVSDIDASDAVTAFSGFGQGVTGVVVDSTNPIPPDTGLTNADFLDMFSVLNATTVVGVGETDGILEWRFSTGEGFDFLAKGEQLTLTYTVQVSDKHAEDTQEVVIVIEGTNDRPTVKNSLQFHSKGFRGDPANSIDADDFDNNGTLVSDLIRAQQEDVDVFGSLQGIAVQGVDFTFTTTGADSWEFSTDGGVTWTAFDADLSAENATVLSTDARVRFVPDSGGENTGWAQLKFVLWDQTDGNPSGTTGVDSTELFVFKDDGTVHGESAYGQQMLWFTVEVSAPANDGPTAGDDNYDVPADSITTLGSVLSNDADPDTPNGDLTASILGTVPSVNLLADGTFTFDSTGILPGQSFSFQYVVTDGSESDVGTVTINVTEADVTIDGPAEVILGKGNNVFNASTSSLGTLAGQQWSVDGVPTASGSSFTFDPAAPGTFVLSYVAMDTTGAIASGSVTVDVVAAAIVDGDLVIGGTSSADAISVNVVGSNYRVNVNGVLTEFAIADVTGDIIICGLDGDDDIRVAAGITQSTQIFAGAGNDTVFGGGGRDVVDAGSGDDTVFGRSGNDFLLGGQGIDTLNGSSGNDNLSGGSEDDILSGGTGDDTVSGQDGNDIVNGDGGNDILLGGLGNDTLAGGGGDDDIQGMSGDDIISGNTGDDTITGGGGNDTISAGNGNDIVDGGLGDDNINANAGDDIIFGQGGDDTILGGLGDDQLFGGAGDDDIFGNAGDDELTGGAGIDLLNGGLDTDTSIDVGETEVLIEL